MNDLRTTGELLSRLRKHPIVTRDGQNITSDAANKIEQQQKKIYELSKTIKTYEVDLDAVLSETLAKLNEMDNAPEQPPK